MNEKIDFSKRFVSALDNAGFSTLSNAKLGKLFGVSAPMITHYRHGEKLPSVDTLIRIANKCKVSVIWLIQGMGEMNLVDVRNHQINAQEPDSTYNTPSIDVAINHAKKIKDDFGIYFVLGAVSLIFLQMFINIGMNIGLLPVVGLPLPFVSYGGSAMISSLIMVGVSESIIIRSKVL